MTLWSRFLASTMLVKLIVINTLVFLIINIVLVFVSLTGNPNHAVLVDYGLYLSCTASFKELLVRPWSIITYMFAHVDFWHLVSNMIVLYVFGRIFSEFFGLKKLLTTYIAGGICGFLLFIISYNFFPAFEVEHSRMVGASASVMAILLASATYMPQYRINLVLLGPVPLWLIAVFFVILDFVSLRYFSNAGGHLAHLGGGLYGFMLATQWRRGKNIGGCLENLLDKISLSSLLKRRSKLRVVKNVSRVPKSNEEYNAERKAKQDKIDRILDKISRSGYDSLTKDEKDFLFRQSDN